MNFGAMQQLFWQRIDQSGSPDFTAIETDRLLNWGYDIFYIIQRNKFGVNQANTINLTYLLRPFTFTGQNEITVTQAGTDLPDYRDLATMKAVFNYTDCNGVAQTREVNVEPLPLGSKDVSLTDPFNKPTNQFPYYTQEHNGTNPIIKIFSTTTPVSVSGSYFKKLQVIDGAGSPNTDFEAQDYVARQVIDLAKILAKGDIDDYPAVKNAVMETGMVLTV